MKNSLLKLRNSLLTACLIVGLAAVTSARVSFAQSWTETTVDPANDAYFKPRPVLRAPDVNTVFIAYYRNIGTNYDLYFAKSTNGGTTWTTNQVYSSTPSIYLALGMDVVDANTIFIAYYDSQNRLSLAKSTTGGSTWTHFTIGSISGCSGVEYRYGDSNRIALDAIDTNTIFMATHKYRYVSCSFVNDGLVLLISATGGSTWTDKPVPTISKYGVFTPSIHAINANTIYISDWDTDTKDLVFTKSTDSGSNWTKKIILSPGYYSTPDLYVVDANTIFISYRENTGNVGLAKSIDAGLNWATTAITGSDDSTGWDNPLYAVDANTIFIYYNQSGTPDAARLDKSVDGGSTWFPTNPPMAYGGPPSIRAFDANTIYLGYEEVWVLKFATSGGGSSYVDCGLRVSDGVSPIPIILSCEDPLVTQCGNVGNTDSLCINTQSKKYGIKLVDPADANASRVRIGAPDGAGGTVIKALRKQ